ncbi:unnamed protein product [Caenorhabditis bovis]|uniref:Ubiquitin carboxyl-terminal hydrolase 36 n=1 Tax=Caenorhabditis bovis TaxID=2654633 RepID=A0A8S1EC55_9PELO|nr:unnamed protein product [Caenorhabditis bovis]
MTVALDSWENIKTNKWLFQSTSSFKKSKALANRDPKREETENHENSSNRSHRPRTLSERGNAILDKHEAALLLYAWKWSDLKENYDEKGIHNPSIYCYAISCVQLLSHVPAVVRLLQEHRCNDSVCLCCNWKRSVLQSNGIGSISWFREAFKKNRKFNQGRQEDAHDALLAILEKIDKIIPETPGLRYKGRKISDDLFGYSIRNEVTCKHCKQKHVYYENNTVMTVRMVKKDPTGRNATIKDLMQQLFTNSTIYGYNCETCKKKSDAPVKPTLLRAPQILALHISRFSFDGYGQKISRPIILNETIDVSEMATEQTSTSYKFCGAVVHNGKSLDYGHYYCVARHRRRESVYVVLNDSSVTSNVNIRDVSQAYIALYRRAEHVEVQEKSMM